MAPAEAQAGRQQRRVVWLDVDPGHDDALALILAGSTMRSPAPLAPCHHAAATRADPHALAPSLFAGYSPSLELLGVSTVAGNQTVEKVTDNALRVLAAAGLQHIQVVAGAARPLLRPAPILCPEIHGETGLDGPLGGPVLPAAPHGPLPGKAPVVMFQCISEAFQRLNGSGGSSAGGGGGSGDGAVSGSSAGSEPVRVQLVATAALTNVALLLALYPEVRDMIEVGAW